MKAVRNFLFFITFLFLSSHMLVAKEKEKIEALLLIDSKSNLSRSVEHDEKAMLDTLQTIASTTNMELQTTIYKGNSVSQENIQKWLASLQKSSHDVVLFYFSGHGCKDFSKLVPWPNLFFSVKGMLFPMKSVIQSIESTNTRLSIIVSDCCNGPLGRKAFCLSLQSKAARHTRKKKISQGALTLFIKTKGHIRATASAPGQPAYSLTRGSIFTLALSQSLTDALVTPNPSWEHIFQSTSSLCETLQTPYISLELK
jgi:hypothetical protein